MENALLSEGALKEKQSSNEDSAEELIPHNKREH